MDSGICIWILDNGYHAFLFVVAVLFCIFASGTARSHTVPHNSKLVA